jgi:hypothetical protein
MKIKTGKTDEVKTSKIINELYSLLKQKDESVTDAPSIEFFDTPFEALEYLEKNNVSANMYSLYSQLEQVRFSKKGDTLENKICKELKKLLDNVHAFFTFKQGIVCVRLLKDIKLKDGVIHSDNDYEPSIIYANDLPLFFKQGRIVDSPLEMINRL